MIECSNVRRNLNEGNFKFVVLMDHLHDQLRDLIIFLWDPMQPQAHDVDIKALLRISVLYNVPTACNRSTADFMISSPLINEDYEPLIKDYTEYINREV